MNDLKILPGNRVAAVGAVVVPDPGAPCVAGTTLLTAGLAADAPAPGTPAFRARVVSEFNSVFGWSFPETSGRETLVTMQEYAALRGRRDIAAKMQQLLK